MPDQNNQKKFNLSIASKILGVFFLVLSLGAGVLLVSEPQLFKQKASVVYSPNCSSSCSTDKTTLLTCMGGYIYSAPCPYGCTGNTLNNSFACLPLQNGGNGSGGFDTPCTTEVYNCPGTIGDAGTYGGVCFDIPNDGCPSVAVASAIASKPVVTPTPQSVQANPNPSPTPTLAPVGQINKKVLVLDFDPLINGSTPLHTYKGWNDPVTLDTQYVADVKSASHGYVNYQIVNTQVIRDYPTKTGGFKFTEAQFLGCLTDSTPSYCLQMADYNKILTDYSVCEQQNAGTIDEVWLWGAPYFGYWEASMAGPGAFNINGGVITGTTCQHKLPIMGFNYERSVNEMIHDLGHRSEFTMINVVGSKSPYIASPVFDFTKVTDRFFAYDKASPGKASCGTAHYPPNGINDYDYNNSNPVVSKCEDWLNYPSTRGVVTSINNTAWGSTYFIKWWLTHLPYATGTTNGKLNNWWAYIVDYDNSVTRSPYETEKWFAVENGANDQNISCGTDTTGSEVYFGVNSACSPATNYVGKFTFPGVGVAKNTGIVDAYLEFVGDGPYTNSLTENIVLSDGTATSIGTTWNINTNWTSGSIVKSPTLTAAVQQIVNGASWVNGGTITVSVNHVSGTGSRRVFAFERESMAGARLVIKTGILPTPTPSLSPSPSPSPSPTPLPSLNYDKKISVAGDDYDITGCGEIANVNEVYIGLDVGCTPTKPYIGYFVFKDVYLNKNATVTNSYIEFTLDGPYSTAMTEQIDVSDGITTSSAVSWPITANWVTNTKGQTPSLNLAIQQVLSSPSWTPGKSLTFRVSHVSGDTTRRVFAYERDVLKAPRLVVNTTLATPSPSPTPNMIPPTLLTPSNNGYVNPSSYVSFDWSDVIGATGYQLQVAWTSDFSQLSANVTTTASNYTFTQYLQGSTKFYWRVKSNFQNGSSAWSSVFTFETNYPPGQPSRLYPANGSMTSTTKPQLIWGSVGSVAGINDYYLQVSDKRDFSSFIVNSHLGVTTSYQFTTALTPGTNYYWRVQARDIVGQTSTFWDFSTFTVPPTGATSQTVTYQVSSSGDDYYFNCDGTTASTSTSLILGANPGCTSQPRYITDLVFKNVQIPKYAAITDAHLEVVSAANNTSDFTLYQNVSSSGLSDSNEWPITTNWSNNQVVTSPSFANPMNQITSYYNWVQGNTVIVRLSFKDGSGSGTRTIKSFDAGASTAAKLVVTYIPKPIVAPTPTPVPSGTASCTVTASPLINMSNQQVLTVGQLEQTTNVTANVTATGGTVTNVTFEPQPFWNSTYVNFDVCDSVNSICPTFSKVYTDTASPFNAKITSQYNHNFGPLKITAVMNTGDSCTTTVMMGGNQPSCFTFKDQNGITYQDDIPWNLKSGNTYTMTPTKAVATDSVTNVLYSGGVYDSLGVLQTSTFLQAYPQPVTYKPSGNYTSYTIIAGRPNYCKVYSYFSVK